MGCRLVPGRLDSYRPMTSLFLTFTVSLIMTGETDMAWKRPRIREICIGMEINGYLPAEI
jgi:coenzyme PQQ precursor peptide PqqA